MLFDTHTHLDAPQFDEDREDMIKRAVQAGVTRMINIGFNRETIPTTIKLAETYDFIHATCRLAPGGCHYDARGRSRMDCIIVQT